MSESECERERWRKGKGTESREEKREGDEACVCEGIKEYRKARIEYVKYVW